MTTTMRISDLAAATPASRDRVMDLLRAASIAVVVIGHWLMASITYADGSFAAGNALDQIPGAWALTWILQVMPIFFLVGGFANLGSWRSAQRRGDGLGAFLAGRLQRLLRPTVLFVGIWTAAWLLFGARIEAAGLTDAGEMIAKPLWFLAVYLAVITLTPIMARAHGRAPIGTVFGLVVAAACTDVLRFAVAEPIGYANFAFVWLLAHQLGFLYADGSFARAGRRVHALMAVGGLACVAILTNIGVYAPGLVSSGGELASNNSPPSIVLVAHTVWLTGLVLLASPALRRWLQRPRVWTAVIGANAVVMTLFLWHLTAMAIGVVALFPLGFPQPDAGTTAWWLTRPLWIAVLAVLMIPLLIVFRRAEGFGSRPASVRAPIQVAGASLALAGLASLAGAGFSVMGAGLVGGGWALAQARS